MPLDPAKRLMEMAASLSEGQQQLLVEMAEAMTVGVTETVSDESDIVVATFAANFSNRLLIHHATHDEKFKKKAFEFAFRSASEASGKAAQIVSSQTNPGADVIVDGERFSLKTEAAKSIRQSSLTISKLMEARWIRDCKNEGDFRDAVANRVVGHLDEYERILALRAFDINEAEVRYDLVEVPVDLLRSVGGLVAENYKPKSGSGGSRAEVKQDGKRVFSLVLDGSVEKITISNLLLSACHVHASWVVPVLNRRQEGAEGSSDEQGE